MPEVLGSPRGEGLPLVSVVPLCMVPLLSFIAPSDASRPTLPWLEAPPVQLLIIPQCLCPHDMTASQLRDFTDTHLSPVPYHGYGGWAGFTDGAATMTGRIQSEKTPRERFLEAALKELEKFERRENDFLKKERQDRAVELKLYLDNFTSRRPGRLF